MKKYLITILCASLAILVIAGVPRLSRSDLGHVTMIENPVSETSKITGRESVQSIQQFTRERHLNLSDSSLNNRAPRRQSIEDLLGAKIAEVDAFNFNWNNETGTAEIQDSSCAMMGKYCKLRSHSPSTGNVFLLNFYGDFEIPLTINPTTGIVTLKTCQPLCTMFSYSNSAKSESLTATGNACWTLYAVPYSWLMGNDNCGDSIYGQVKGDSIMFNDIFAFLVETVDGDSVSWGLSPIFKNLTLLTPNGTHGFYYTRQVIVDLDPVGSGYGGLVPPPNKPGPSKPVSRPISSIIGVNNPSSFNYRFIEIMPDTHLLHITELLRMIDEDKTLDHGQGYGGLVPPPRKSGSSQPVTPRLSAPINEANSSINGSQGTINDSSFEQIEIEHKTTHELVPVYMVMVDDTTLMVYNLFGMGMRCHMKIDINNGTMYLPCQQVYNNGLGRVWKNRSCDGALSQDGAIRWDITTLIGSSLSPSFHSNVLRLLGNLSFTVPLEPEFDEPIVTDTTVMFSATTNELNGIEVILYMYDEETDEYLGEDNPLTVPRLDAPYWIFLAAISYNPYTGVSSDIIWFDYEIPALETIGIRGDVNLDSQVNISDVTAMINGLLSSNWEGISFDNADCNTDGDVTISDVTTLINYLLSGNWSD